MNSRLKRLKQKSLIGLTSILLSTGTLFFPNQAHSQGKSDNPAVSFLRKIESVDKYFNAFGIGTGGPWESYAQIIEESETALQEIQEQINKGEPFTYWGVEFDPFGTSPKKTTNNINTKSSQEQKTPTLSELEKSLLGTWTSSDNEVKLSLNSTNLILDLGEDYAEQTFPNETYELKPISQGILLKLPSRTPGQKEILLKRLNQNQIKIDKPTPFKSYSNKKEIEFSENSPIINNPNANKMLSSQTNKNSESLEDKLEEYIKGEWQGFINGEEQTIQLGNPNKIKRKKRDYLIGEYKEIPASDFYIVSRYAIDLHAKPKIFYQEVIMNGPSFEGKNIGEGWIQYPGRNFQLVDANNILLTKNENKKETLLTKKGHKPKYPKEPKKEEPKSIDNKEKSESQKIPNLQNKINKTQQLLKGLWKFSKPNSVDIYFNGYNAYFIEKDTKTWKVPYLIDYASFNTKIIFEVGFRDYMAFEIKIPERDRLLACEIDGKIPFEMKRKEFDKNDLEKEVLFIPANTNLSKTNVQQIYGNWETKRYQREISFKINQNRLTGMGKSTRYTINTNKFPYEMSFIDDDEKISIEPLSKNKLAIAPMTKDNFKEDVAIFTRIGN